MEEHLVLLEAELKLLTDAYNQNLEAGGVSNFRKGDMSTSFIDLEKKITAKKNEIALVKANL